MSRRTPRRLGALVALAAAVAFAASLVVGGIVVQPSDYTWGAPSAHAVVGR
ncbi:MAG: hypothetical protein WA890_05740 [Micromonospora sp.]